MGRVSGFRQRVQILCAVLALLVAAASAGIRQDDSDTVMSGMAPVAVVLTSSTNEPNPNPAVMDDDRGMTGRFAERVLAEPEAEAARSNPAKPADAGVVDPPEASDSGGKVIYLTFDDGPTTKYTQRILDLLDEYDAKATFFQVGENATAHPELTRSVIERGHALGNHTWSHEDLRKLSRGKLNLQITRTSAALQRITGRPITCMRPPFGAVNARVKSTIRDRKLAMKLWDIDPRDWKRPGSAAIARRVVSNAHPGAVSLMHDGGGNRSQSVAALKRILRSLSKQRYDFKTLPGC